MAVSVPNKSGSGRSRSNPTHYHPYRRGLFVGNRDRQHTAVISSIERGRVLKRLHIPKPPKIIDLFPPISNVSSSRSDKQKPAIISISGKTPVSPFLVPLLRQSDLPNPRIEIFFPVCTSGCYFSFDFCCWVTGFARMILEFK